MSWLASHQAPPSERRRRLSTLALNSAYHALSLVLARAYAAEPSTRARSAVNLSETPLDAADKPAALKLMRTIGSMGNRGPLRHLHLAAQEPPLALAASKDLKLEGVKLGLGMDVPAITAAMETAEYLKQQLIAEEEAFSRVQKSFDALASSEAAFGRGFKRLATASFIKQIHL